MKLVSILLLFMIFITLPLCGETFFVSTDEKYNGEVVPLEEQVREGILDSLFEAGHIVIDDCKTVSMNDIMTDASVAALLRRATDIGMPFLVVVRVSSEKGQSNAGERIQTIASYSLYDVDKKALAGSGKLEANNAGKEKELGRVKLWFKIGEDIASRIAQLYADYRIHPNEKARKALAQKTTTGKGQ